MDTKQQKLLPYIAELISNHNLIKGKAGETPLSVFSEATEMFVKDMQVVLKHIAEEFNSQHKNKN